MSKVNILKINPYGVIKEIPIINDIKHFNILISRDINIYLLYWWLLDGDKYEAYGNIEQEECIEKNNHRLPINGLSDLLEENSDSIHIYGNITSFVEINWVFALFQYYICKRNRV